MTTPPKIRFIDWYDPKPVDERSSRAAPKERDRLWYLASPYTKRATGDGDAQDEGLRRAYYEAVGACAALTRQGLTVISPILHSHVVGVAAKIDLRDGKFWEAVNRPLVEAAGGLLILPVEGWLQSDGMAHEIKSFVERTRPIYILSK